MARQSAVSREAREYIEDQIKERGIVTIEEVAELISEHYCFDPLRVKEREIANYARRLMASIRGESGVKTVLSVKGSPGLFAGITTCRSLPVLGRIDAQLTEKMDGLKKPLSIIKARKKELEGQYSMFEQPKIENSTVASLQRKCLKSNIKTSCET